MNIAQAYREAANITVTVSGAPGGIGAKGDPGGNVMAVGTRDQLGGMIVPAGAGIIQTTGDAAPGAGPWLWLRSADQATGGDAYRRQDAAGVWFDKITTLLVPFGPPTGGTAAGVTYLLDPQLSRFGVMATDPAPLNDTLNNFAGIVAALGRQPNMSDQAIYSLVSGRNNYVWGGGYGTAFGHDCLNVAVAAMVGGAGAVVGRHDDPVQGRLDEDGYCSINVSKNGRARGRTSAVFGEQTVGDCRGATVAGYINEVRRTAGLGAFSFGSRNVVDNGGIAALGDRAFADGANKITIGRAINPGQTLTNDIDGALVIGMGAAGKGTFVMKEAVAGDAFFSRIYSKTGWRTMGDIGAALNVEWGGFSHLLNNSAGGGRTVARISTLKAGTPTAIIEIRDDYLAPITDNAVALGGASTRFSTVFAGTGTINTSDERTKQDFSPVPDAWLDAWGEVEWSRFRFKDSVAEKGDAARWHIGLVAQQVRDIFASHGLDALEIGLLCYDAWEAVTEPATEEYEVVSVEQRIEPSVILGPDGQRATKIVEVEHRHTAVRDIEGAEPIVVREAGDLWGLRYDECQALEAAWVRRELARK